MLGVRGGADGATILAALDEALAERDDPADGEPDQVLLTTAQFEQLQADADLGHRAQLEAVAAAAVEDGRISASGADLWVARLAADPGAADALASLQPVRFDLEPTTQPRGYEDIVNSDPYTNWSLS